MKTSLLISVLTLALATAACTSGASGNGSNKNDDGDDDDSTSSSSKSDSVDGSGDDDDDDSESSSSSSKRRSSKDEDEKEEPTSRGKAPGATCKEDVDCANELCLFDTGADFGVCTTECTSVATCPGGVAKWSACEKVDNSSGKYCIPR